MAQYISNSLEGLIRLISQILNKNKQNREFMSKLQESLESLRDIIDHLKKVNFSNLERAFIRNLEISIDKAVRFIFKRLKISTLSRIFELDTERFKLKMHLNSIMQRLNQIKLIYLNKFIESFKSSLENLDQVRIKQDILLSKFSNLEKINNGLFSSIEESLKESKKISKLFYLLNNLLPELNSKASHFKRLIYATIENYFKTIHFLRLNDTESLKIHKEVKISIAELKEFADIFIYIPENKERLLKKKIIPINENVNFMNQIYLLFLDDYTGNNLETNNNGRLINIESYGERFNFCVRDATTYEIKPLKNLEPIYSLVYFKKQLRVKSKFVVLDHGNESNPPTEYLFNVTNIERGDDSINTTKTDIPDVKLHLMVTLSDEPKEEIFLTDHTKYKFLHQIITFQNGQYYLQPNNKFFSVFYYLRPLRSYYLNTSTVLRIGDSKFQIVFK